MMRDVAPVSDRLLTTIAPPLDGAPVVSTRPVELRQKITNVSLAAVCLVELLGLRLALRAIHPGTDVGFIDALMIGFGCSLAFGIASMTPAGPWLRKWGEPDASMPNTARSWTEFGVLFVALQVLVLVSLSAGKLPDTPIVLGGMGAAFLVAWLLSNAVDALMRVERRGNV